MHINSRVTHAWALGSFRLSGALAVQDDLDAEQIARVSRHLGGIATVYLAHDGVAHSVAMRISGIMSPDDTRIVEKRIEKFAEEYCSAGAILLSEWNGLSTWLVVGMNWQVQCLLKFAAVEEQFARLAQKDIDFLVRLEPNESAQGRRGNLITSFSVTVEEPCLLTRTQEPQSLLLDQVVEIA